MAENACRDDVLDPLTLEPAPRVETKAWPRRGFGVFKRILELHDGLLALLIWVLCDWTLGDLWLYADHARQWVLPGLGAVLVVIYFPFYQLYSQHLIFSRRKHVTHMIRAFACSLSSLVILALAYVLPMVYAQYSLPILLALFVLLFIFLNFTRFAGESASHLFQIFGICMFSLGALGIIYQGHPPVTLQSARVMAAAFPLSVGVLLFSRLFLVQVVFNKLLRKHFRSQVAVVGSDEQAREVVSFIIERNAPFWVAGTIGDGCRLDAVVKKDCLGPVAKLPGIAAAHKIDELLVTDPAIDKRTLICILDFCLDHAIPVWFPPNLLEIVDRKLYIDNFCGRPMIKLCSPKRIWFINKVKHALDAVASLILLVLLLPLLAAVAVAIKANSKGPVFYRARAIGKGGREFRMFKFRSMYTDISADIHKDYVSRLIKGEIGQDTGEGKALKITDDPRVTPVGKFIRKYSLDELPQLINVVKGEMSLVGPRPCLPYEYELYQDWYKKRTCVRPGITGLWQVAGRSEVAFEEMILLDLYYIYNRSLWLDLNILIETVFAVLEKRGAY